MLLKFKTLIVVIFCFVGMSRLGVAASLEKAILLNEHGLTTDAKRELIDLIFEKRSKADDKAQAYYLLGNIAFGEDKIKVALNSWEYLVNKYPKSDEAGLVRDRIAELSEIVVGSAKENLDNAIARSYLRHADFWSDNKSEIFKIDSSWISNVEAAVKWYDRILTEFPNSKASRIAYEGKLRTLLGWKEVGQDGKSYGIRSDFTKYMPLLLQAFKGFEKDHSDAPTLQAFRYQIAQAYWRNALSLRSRAQSAQDSTKYTSLYTPKEIQDYRKQAQHYQEEAEKHLITAKEWLNEIINIAGDRDVFYRDIAERRLKNLEPY